MPKEHLATGWSRWRRQVLIHAAGLYRRYVHGGTGASFLIEGDVVEEVGKLKAQEGGEIQVHGATTSSAHQEVEQDEVIIELLPARGGIMRSPYMLFLFSVVTFLACRSEAPDLEAERRAILETDEAWLAAAGRKDLDAAVSYWTDDATVFPPDMPAIRGKAAIREYVAAGFEIPGFSISWRSEEITVAADGRSAYQFATNRLTAPDSSGTLRTVEGKAVVIWRKEADGAWRAVVDIWNGAGSQDPAPSAQDSTS